MTTQKPDKFWDWIARRYDKTAWSDTDLAESLLRVEEHLQPHQVVLDFACGTGVISLVIAPLVDKVHGIDSSARMIDLAGQNAVRKRITNVEFRQATVFDDDLQTEDYDIVLAFNILHLLPDAKAAVNRAHQLLKPGGLLISSTPCLGDAGAIVTTLVPLVRKVGLLSNLTALSGNGLQATLIDRGFKITQSNTSDGAIPCCFFVGRKGSIGAE